MVPRQSKLSEAFVQNTAKKMMTAAIAIELSSAALSTNVKRFHQALYLLLIKTPKKRPTIAQLP